jgi:DNA mismatch repair protein MSH6
MDELGRGTSTFDGTAIAHGAVHHLVTTSKCLSLFATHYHSLLDEWGNDSNVQLGHMECLVESKSSDPDSESESSREQNRDRITFLYTLGEGVCPKSFGINVARLAHLPEEVLSKAMKISGEFESRTNTSLTKANIRRNVTDAVECGDWGSLLLIWEGLQV